DTVYQKALPGASEVVSSPALLDDLLLVASGERLLAADLVDLLEVSPGASRKRVLELQGTVCAHLASDGRRYAAVGTRSEGEAWLQVFELTRGGLHLLWKRSPCRLEDPHAFLALAVTGDAVVVGEPSGQLWAYSMSSGKPLGDARLPVGLSPCPMLGRVGSALAAGSDGSLFRVVLGGGLQALSLAEPCEQPLYAVGASQEDALLCHGRLLRRVHLPSGRLSGQQLPQHCTVEPVVTRNLAAALSDDGTLYVLHLSSDLFQVFASRKVLSCGESGVVPPAAARGYLFLGAREGELACVRLALQ
ncbi:MAG: hypothetical protein AB1758_08100, partial [Candidatus Eremiobacterota bacterium]